MNVERDWRKLSLPHKDREQLAEQMKSLRAYFTLGQNGRLITRIDDTSIRPFDLALAFFVRIAADPEG